MREPLSYDIAHRATEAALTAARAEGVQICAVTVNRSGVIKVLLSDDGAGPIAVETARRKAYTAAVTGTASGMLATLSADPLMAFSPPHLVDSQLLPVPGGRPIVVDDGEVIGAIGVGGAHANIDDRLAEEALKAVAAQLT
jgi:glc operon protein GlcG